MRKIPVAFGVIARRQFAKGGLAQAAEKVRRAGRNGDTVVVHISPEEFSWLRRNWGEPTRNPKTGLPEYFKLGEFFKAAAPVIPALASFIPGVGPAVAGLGTSLGATGAWAPVIGSGALGAGIGALTRGGLKGAIEGGLMGGAASAFMPVASNVLGLGPEQATVFGFDPAKATAQAAAPAAAAPAAAPGASAPAAPPAGSFTSWLKENKTPVVLGGGALLLASQLGSSRKPAPAPTMPAGTPSSFKPVSYRVENRPVSTAPVDWYSYGMRPRNDASNPLFVNRDLVMARDGGHIRGGDVSSLMARLAAGGQPEHQGGREGNVSGPGTGRSDDIPARLSDGEYVIDAETVAMLGDGSSEAGARALDNFRSNVRKHKGAALSRGKISPNAKHPEAYMKGGRS